MALATMARTASNRRNKSGDFLWLRISCCALVGFISNTSATTRLAREAIPERWLHPSTSYSTLYTNLMQSSLSYSGTHKG